MEDQPYDGQYWDNYLRMDASPSGQALTDARVAWVLQHIGEERLSLCDIGIGGGRFVKEINGHGFDVNLHAVQWLKTGGRWFDPYAHAVDVATFWDSLEHIHDPAPLLKNVRQWVFTSLPIFRDVDHIRKSKHFKKSEHCWYFTRRGLEGFMDYHGFEQVGMSLMEQECGREDIETFAFRRKHHG